MTKIKICGLSRPCDVAYVNEARPDFCGFVIGVPQSRRNVTPETARSLRKALDPAIHPVGVFVDAPPALIAALTRDGTLSAVQLHGQEDNDYLARLREVTDKPVIQAFRIRGAGDLERAAESTADILLLDNGTGTGQSFDWSLIRDIERPWILAGGLGPSNVAEAVRRFRPYAVDLSSGAETDGLKDPEKMMLCVEAVRKSVSRT